MYKFFLFLFITLILSCNPMQDDEFQIFYKDFQKTMGREPLIRAIIEDQIFIDTLLVIPQKKEINRILSISKENLEALHQFEQNRLNPNLHEHHKNLHSLLTLIIDKIEVQKKFQSEPSFYSVLAYLDYLTTQKNIDKIEKGLDQIAFLLQIAIENLENINSEKLKNAINEGTSTFEFLSTKMKKHIRELDLAKEKKKRILIKLTRAKLAEKNYIAFCNSKIFDLGEPK
jgi:paraquat-inducible protein B